jgi:hypothetical protein
MTAMRGDFMTRTFNFIHDPTTVNQKFAPYGGQVNAPWKASEHTHTKLFLKGVDVARQGRLNDTELLGGPSDVAGFCNRNEKSDAFNFHIWPLYYFSTTISNFDESILKKVLVKSPVKA